ncbi:MAG TPA: VanZ family protein [Candidatus Paenibacillus intestinavium]|nr:VanZ family protein [Candidatus Paenibacillus intestinavium]
MDDSIMFTIQSGYFLMPVLLIYVLYTTLGVILKYKKRSIGQFFVLTTFCVYLLCVIHLVLFPIEVNIGKFANLTPWYKVINFVPILTLDMKTFLLNIIMFIPLGIYLPLLKNKFNSANKVAYLALFFSLSIEVFQLIMRIVFGNGRSTDINDLIANTFGGIIGYLILKTLLKSKWWNDLLNKMKL